MAGKRDAFLQASASDDSDDDRGYDSEAAEQLKGGSSSTTGRAPKRRKLSDVESVSDTDDNGDVRAIKEVAALLKAPFHSSTAIDASTSSVNKLSNTAATSPRPPTKRPHNPTTTTRLNEGSRKEKQKKKKTPGVVYLSSLPPYLRPSALRNLLSQRGFEPITRLFLAPALKKSTTRTSTSKSKRQLYTEGWIEFSSKTTARRCAAALNAAPVGGKKGGFYRDDVWNMKYLSGMGWEELMAGVREERREEEGRRDEERLVLARETRRFVGGVERGREMRGREDGRAKKRVRERERKEGEDGGEGGNSGSGGEEEAAEVRRTWRQFEVKGMDRKRDGGGDGEAAVARKDEPVGEDVRRVLGKIF